MSPAPLSNTVRVVEIDGQPWFAATDVCDILELTHVASSLNKLADDEVRLISRSNVDRINISFPNRGLNCVSESWLNKLIMRSDKPEAREFQDWVTREVLPAIRKDGMYLAGEEKVKSGELTPASGILFTRTVRTSGRPATVYILNLRANPLGWIASKNQTGC